MTFKTSFQRKKGEWISHTKQFFIFSSLKSIIKHNNYLRKGEVPL